MKRKKLTWLVALAVLFVFSMIMVACNPDPEPEPEPEPTLYTVTFDSNGGSAVPERARRSHARRLYVRSMVQRGRAHNRMEI